MKTLLSIILMSASLFAQAHNNDQKVESHTQIAQASIKVAPVSIKYTLTSAGQSNDWFMIRSTDNIVTYNDLTRHGEIWSRDPQGNIEYRRIFAEDKKLIEYANGELKAMNKEPDWNRLQSIFDPKTIAKLSKTGEAEILGNHADKLEGVLDGVRTTVWWLPALQIPARVEQGKDAGQHIMVMQELYEKAPKDWNWADSSTLLNYDRIDASDFGDMESDPFVQKVLLLDGHQHKH